MIRDNSIGNPFIDSVRNTSGTRKGFSGYSNIATGRVRNITHLEYHGHLTGTYMVSLNDSGSDQLIPCKLLKTSASMDGVGDYVPLEEGDPVTVLFKDGRMDMGYILGGTHTEGKYREFLIEGKGQEPFSLTNTGSKDVEINQPSIHPDRIATPDAQFFIVGSRDLGKDPYSDTALGDASDLGQVASQRPQPGSILIRNKQGDIAQYAKGDIILYADGDIILFSNKTKDAECNKLRMRVQYYKDLIKKLETKFGIAGSNSSDKPSPTTTPSTKDSKSITDPFKIDPNTQKLTTTKIEGLVDLLTSKNITKLPEGEEVKYSVTNVNRGSTSISPPKLGSNPLKNAEALKEHVLNMLTTSASKPSSKDLMDVINQAKGELDKVPINDKTSPSYQKASNLKTELETLSSQIAKQSILGNPESSKQLDESEDIKDSMSLPPDHPKNREKTAVNALLNADHLEPYILRYHIDQLNKLVSITVSEIESCQRELSTVQSTLIGSTNSSGDSPVNQGNTPNQSTTNYNPSKSKCGKGLLETIKNLREILGKDYGSGTCYEGVADAIEYAGLGKLGGDCQTNGPNGLFNMMPGYTSWAVDFARFFNEDPSRLKKFNIRNLKAEGIVDPNDPRVPPGAVIVVGENKYVRRIEGDINIKTDDGQFLNPRSMTSWMTDSEYWKANPNEVHGIFIEDVPTPPTTPSPTPAPKATSSSPTTTTTKKP